MLNYEESIGERNSNRVKRRRANFCWKVITKKRKKIEKKEKKKARIAVIKAANKKKAKLNKQEKKVLDKERISKTEQKDGEDTEKAGNTSDSQSDEKKIIKKKKSALQNISHCKHLKQLQWQKQPQITMTITILVATQY